MHHSSTNAHLPKIPHLCPMAIIKKIIFLLLLSTALQAQTKAPFVLGVVDTVHSVILQEKRVLNIYLPVGYHPDSAARYPVIYLLDGSADEDFIHVAGLVQFCNFPWVNMLPPSIVVGIANTQRRRDLTFPTTIAQDKKNLSRVGRLCGFYPLYRHRTTALYPTTVQNQRYQYAHRPIAGRLVGH